jgi:PleD family two-component response regulator
LTAERIRRELEKQTITSVTGGEVKVTVSAGVAGDQGPALDKQKVVLEVEAALTRAKEEGRNRVCAV